jgi:hypothetical protein
VPETDIMDYYLNTMNYYTVWGNYGISSGVAQPYYTDDIILVRGIAAFVLLYQYVENNPVFFCDAQYFQIRKQMNDSSILAQARYDTINNPSTAFRYIEFLFGNSIILKDTFFVSVTKALNNPYYPIDGQHQECFSNCSFDILSNRPKNKDSNDICCSQLAPLIKTPASYFWQTFQEDTATTTFGVIGEPLTNAHFFANCNPSLFLFPILDTIPVTYSQADASVITDTIDSIFTFTMEILGQGYPAMPYEIGFVVSTDSNYLNLENGSVYNFLYDTTNNYYSQVFNFTTFPCNTDLYMRSFVLTKIYTTYGDTLTHIDYGDINSFSYNCIEADTNNITTIYNNIQIKLYPNPTDKELTIETTLPMQKVEVINSNGQTIYINEPNKKEVKINTSKFVSGNYIAVITTSKGIVKRSFVVK